jgi:hypothetical protein
MKQASKPRDYSSNKQDSSSKPQNAHSKQHGKQSDRQPDRQHEKQQQGKSKCPDYSRSHPGACRTNTSNSSNPTSKSSNLPSNTNTSTKVTELATSEITGKSFFAKGAAESSQHTWHIDSGANYTTTSNKAWFVSYEARENEYI